MTSATWSFQQYCDVLWLRNFGCPVDYPDDQGRLQLRLEQHPTEFNVYPVPGGTAIAFWVDIRAASALTVYRMRFWAPWVRGPISFLQPSEKHDGFYFLPPDLWIWGPEVLNQRLAEGRVLKRNQHMEGFVLGTTPDTLPPSTAEHVEALFGIEDIHGYEHSLVMTLIHRPLGAKVLRDYGEQATFPRPKKRKKKTIATAKPPSVLAADQPAAPSET